MSGAVDAYEAQILDYLFGGAAAPTVQADWHLALFTTNPNDAGSGAVEVAGNNYSRVAVTRNSTNFPAASGGVMANGAVIQFPVPSGSWGTVVGVGFYDAGAAGNLRFWYALGTSKTPGSGDDVEIAVGDLDITLD